MTSSANVATIGDYGDDYHEIEFLSSVNFYEFGAVIASPLDIAEELDEKGHKPLSFDLFVRSLRRLQELSQWVADGHFLILFVTAPTSIRFLDLSGRKVEDYSIYEMDALKSLVFTSITGSRVQFCGSNNLSSLLKPHVDALRYEAMIEGTDLQPLFRVQTSKSGISQQIVGGIKKHGDEHVVCVPPPSDDSERADSYVAALLTATKLVSARSSLLPAWVEQFRTNEESASFQKMLVLRDEIVLREAKIDEVQASLSEARELKALFAGTGSEFCSAVATALSELGLTCVEGPHPRADLLGTDGSRYIAIEAKGVEGTARENNFRQVERWKAEVNSALSFSPNERDADPDLSRYAAQLEKLGDVANADTGCKGLMIVGTYRTTPLDERKGEDFPHAVLRLLPRSDVCALTGLQLFCLVVSARREPSKKRTIAQKLLETTGVLQEIKDWRAYLHLDTTSRWPT